ncbi:hypothetical protein TNCV_1703611 [Trichonephila clavipes]|nr:hypothetical protein TNCV_1703611 [Trichonephila clavipes]
MGHHSVGPVSIPPEAIGKCNSIDMVSDSSYHLPTAIQLSIPRRIRARWNCFLACLFSRSIVNQKRVAHACTHNDWLRKPHPLLHQINFANMWKLHELLYTKNSSKASDSMPRRVAAVTMSATLTTDFVIIHTSQEVVISIV